MIIKVKLYELIETLLLLDNEIINNAIGERSFQDIIMEDYERFDMNSNLLQCLNKVIVAICKQGTNTDIKINLFKQTQILFRLAKRLSLSECSL